MDRWIIRKGRWRERKLTLNICSIVNVNIFIPFMMKRVQRAGDGDITGGGKIMPPLQKTLLNDTQKRSRPPRTAFPIQNTETNPSEFSSSSHSYRAYASLSRCQWVKPLFQFSKATWPHSPSLQVPNLSPILWPLSSFLFLSYLRLIPTGSSGSYAHFHYWVC